MFAMAIGRKESSEKTFEGSSVPQATLDRICTVVRAITTSVRDTKSIAESTTTPQRHAVYAVSAARTLGLITGVADHLKLTSLGRELTLVPEGSRSERQILRQAISSSPLISKIAPGLLKKTPPSIEETISRIQEIWGYSDSTARQRARMIYKWRHRLELKEDDLPKERRTPKQKVRKKPAHKKRVRRYEIIQVSTGQLGPIPQCEIAIKPFTLFVGPQGTGKSLLAQVLYFFRALPELIPAAVAATPRREAKDISTESLVRRLLDGLRSPERAFARFAYESATVRWKPEGEASRVLGFGAYSHNRRVRPDKQLHLYILELMKHYRRYDSRAIFIPTERLFFSQVRSHLATELLFLPSTYTWFSDWMQRATNVFERWKNGTPDTPRGRWVRNRARVALRGEAVRWRDTWKWKFPRGNEEGILDLDMASSGQRATWPIVLLAETLFSMKKRGGLTDAFALYVEEPEIHLHPEAQVAMVEILAYLVNNGFRVVVTTHSLTVMYALNNLVMAGRIPSRKIARRRGFPPNVAALSKEDVAAYSFSGGQPEDLVDPESGFISEVELGRVSEQLNDTMNQLSSVIYRDLD